MKWYNYVACFFAGAFLINSLPHFIHGIDGDAFPTPFSVSSGKGLSSPAVNVLWAIFNLTVAFVLYCAGKNPVPNKWRPIMIIMGASLFGLLLSLMAPTVLAYYKSTH